MKADIESTFVVVGPSGVTTLNYQPQVICTQPGEKLSMVLKAAVPKGNYAVSVFLDYKSIKLDENEVVFWDAENSGIFDFSFDFIAPKEAGIYEFFAIVFSNVFNSKKFPFIITSDKISLIVEKK
ncbi:hypothetical protein [Anoxybacter fermentans]|nr:hypothetical protein [Anoxybacter fermentans]